MFVVKLPKFEFYNSETSEFIVFDEVEIQLEHSLVSLSKWESKHEKPFLGKEEKTDQEIVSYIECMIFSGGVPEKLFERLTEEDMQNISKYIDAKMTATTFTDKPKAPSREVITSELIYYWMFSMRIPMECERWHLNRLLTLIKVCNIKSQPPKKMSKSEIAKRNSQLNAQRKAQLGTNG